MIFDHEKKNQSINQNKIIKSNEIYMCSFKNIVYIYVYTLLLSYYINILLKLGARFE